MTVLVLAAHPDDEVLGCGGTMARLAAEGDDVHVAILGEGITSRYADRSDADPRLLVELHERSQRVARLLGAKDCRLFELPDNRFDTVPVLDIVKIVEDLISELEPQVIFTQHGGDLNVDHVQLFRATMTATRPQAGQCVLDVYAYEVASSTEWAFHQFAPWFTPNVFFNIESTLERKIQAMELYESEARAFPHPRSPTALRAAALRWGSAAGLPAAEAFMLVRGVRP